MVGKIPTTCAVFGCHSRQTKNVQRSFYGIPANTDRRREWLAFIGRINEDGSPWKPGPGHRVCSDHFISGEKSNDPLNPDYVPSIKCEKSDESEDEGEDKDLARYNRGKRRHVIQVTLEKM